MGLSAMTSVMPMSSGYVVGHGMAFYVRKMLKDPEARRAVLLLISRGVITVPEAARLAGVSRQLVRAWCKSRKMSVDRARNARITREWRKAMNE
jgi:hypothetical protein